MDEGLYRNIVAVIKRHSYLIVVADADGYHEFSSLTDDSGSTMPARCLTLKTVYGYGSYPSGHRWYIPLSDLQRAVRKYSEQSVEFYWRVRRKELTRYDVERIILEASYGVIKLNMV